MSVEVKRISNGVIKLRNSIHNFRPSLSLSVRNEQLTSNFGGSFPKLLYIIYVPLQSKNDLGKRTINIIMPVRSSVCVSV
jgi:hypothetical protein